MNTPTHLLLAGLACGMAAGVASADVPATSDEVRAIVADMLADAETRSSLLQGGGAAGFDNGFFIESGDGAFKMNVNAEVQFRYVANFTDDEVDGDDFDSDFQNRLTRLTFSGTVYDDWFYKVQGRFDSGPDGTFSLDDAYVGFGFEEGGALIFGQLKAPVTREELMADSKQLAIESSQVNQYFTAGRTQGVAYKWGGDTVRGVVAFTDGARQANTDLYQTAPLSSDFSITARGEFLLAGSWDQFEDFTSPIGSEDGLMIGVAGHFQTGPGDAGVAEADIFEWTADISWESDGWNLFAAITGRDIEPDTVGIASGHDIGFVVQGGMYVSEDTELYARYGHILLDDDAVPAGSGDESAELAIGVNHYIHGHAVKFSFDVVTYLDEATGSFIGGPVGQDTEIGRRGDMTDDGEVALRAQMQLMF